MFKVFGARMINLWFINTVWHKRITCLCAIMTQLFAILRQLDTEEQKSVSEREKTEDRNSFFKGILITNLRWWNTLKSLIYQGFYDLQPPSSYHSIYIVNTHRNKQTNKACWEGCRKEREVEWFANTQSLKTLFTANFLPFSACKKTLQPLYYKQMKRIILNVVAVTTALFVAPVVALICAIFVFFRTYKMFWQGVSDDLKGPITNENEPNKPKDIWDRHIERQSQKNENKNNGE